VPLKWGREAVWYLARPSIEIFTKNADGGLPPEDKEWLTQVMSSPDSDATYSLIRDSALRLDAARRRAPGEFFALWYAMCRGEEASRRSL